MKVMADIITSEMTLPDLTIDSKVFSPVMLYNERQKIPPTYKDIYIVLAIVSSKIIGTVNRPEDAEAGLSQVQGVTRNEMVQIDIMSQNSEARTRRDEVIMALNSLYAQQQCELYNIKLARIPLQTVDVSALEGTSRLNRYAITINAMSTFNKVVEAEYYDNFSRAVPPTVWVNEEP